MDEMAKDEPCARRDHPIRPPVQMWWSWWSSWLVVQGVLVVMQPSMRCPSARPSVPKSNSPLLVVSFFSILFCLSFPLVTWTLTWTSPRRLASVLSRSASSLSVKSCCVCWSASSPLLSPRVHIPPPGLCPTVLVLFLFRRCRCCPLYCRFNRPLLTAQVPVCPSIPPPSSSSFGPTSANATCRILGHVPPGRLPTCRTSIAVRRRFPEKSINETRRSSSCPCLPTSSIKQRRCTSCHTLRG